MHFAHLLLITPQKHFFIINMPSDPDSLNQCSSSEETTDDEILQYQFPLKGRKKWKLGSFCRKSPASSGQKKTLKQQAAENYFVLQHDLSPCNGSLYEFCMHGTPKAWKRAAPNRVKAMCNPNKDCQQALRSKITELFELNHRTITPISGMSLKLSILFYFPPPKTTRGEINGKADLDNLAKLVLDAFSKLFYKDDRQVCTLFLQKRFGLTESGYMCVSIKEDHVGSLGIM